MAKPLTALEYLELAEKPQAPSVCVIFGDETFLQRQVLGELRQQILGDDDGEFSQATFGGDDLYKNDLQRPAASGLTKLPRQLLDELSTVAMFGGGRRLIVIEDADDFVSKYRPALEDYVAKPKTVSVLVLVVRTWASNTRLFKSVAESGLQIDCKVPAAAALQKWLTKWAKKKHAAQLEADAAEHLVELVGPEMGLLDQELAKLALIAKGAANEKSGGASAGRITVSLVRDTVGGGRAKSVWDMLDLAADGHAELALVELDHLFAAGDHPVAILGPMAASLRRFATAARYFEQAERNRQRSSLRQSLELAGVKTWPAAMEKAERQLRQLGRRRAAQLFRRLLDADLALKGSSSSGDRARLVLEQLIVGMSTQAAALQ